MPQIRRLYVHLCIVSDDILDPKTEIMGRLSNWMKKRQIMTHEQGRFPFGKIFLNTPLLVLDDEHPYNMAEETRRITDFIGAGHQYIYRSIRKAETLEALKRNEYKLPELSFIGPGSEYKVVITAHGTSGDNHIYMQADSEEEAISAAECAGIFKMNLRPDIFAKALHEGEYLNISLSVCSAAVPLELDPKTSFAYHFTFELLRQGISAKISATLAIKSFHMPKESLEIETYVCYPRIPDISHWLMHPIRSKRYYKRIFIGSRERGVKLFYSNRKEDGFSASSIPTREIDEYIEQWLYALNDEILKVLPRPQTEELLDATVQFLITAIDNLYSTIAEPVDIKDNVLDLIESLLEYLNTEASCELIRESGLLLALIQRIFRKYAKILESA